MRLRRCNPCKPDLSAARSVSFRANRICNRNLLGSSPRTLRRQSFQGNPIQQSDGGLDGRAKSAQGPGRAVGQPTGLKGLIMMTLSIGKALSIKAIAPAVLVGTASAAALVYAFTQIPSAPKVESGPIGLMSQPSQPQSGAIKPAIVNADKSGSGSEMPALGSTPTKVATLSAELGAAPSAPAAEPLLPAFDVARVEAGGEAVIAGRAAPGATVDLMRNGEQLDHAVADASGQFVMVPPHLPAGSYELTLSAKLPDGTVALSKQGVTVTVKEADASTGSVAARTETATAPIPVAKPQDTAAAPAPRQAMAAASSEEGVSKSSAASASTRVVARGDSLWRISRIAYGAGQQYAIVYRANRDRIRDPNLIHPGQVLVVPLKQR
jgi:nucleoid-associated protein YgaU